MPIVLSAVLGALLSLAAAESYRKIVPSGESQQLRALDQELSDVSGTAAEASNLAQRALTQHAYLQPSQATERTLGDAISTFVAQHGADRFQIAVEAESGSTARRKVGETLGRFLRLAGVGAFRGGTYIGIAPGSPITIWFAEGEASIARDLAKAISPYVRGEVSFQSQRGRPPGSLRVYLNGDPLFNADGSCVIH